MTKIILGLCMILTLGSAQMFGSKTNDEENTNDSNSRTAATTLAALWYGLPMVVAPILIADTAPASGQARIDVPADSETNQAELAATPSVSN